MTAVCIVAEFDGAKRRTNLSAHSTNSLLFLHSNMQKWQLNRDSVNGDIDKVFLAKERFTSLDVLSVQQLFEYKISLVRSCNVLHPFLRESWHTNWEWQWERIGIEFWEWGGNGNKS